MSFVMPFGNIRHSDVALVGGKNASLGEMFNTLTSAGIRIPDGFAVTATAYRYFLEANQLEAKLQEVLDKLDTETLSNLPEVGDACRSLIRAGVLPDDLKAEIVAAYTTLDPDAKFSVAVRSSATAEDLPEASFAGQHESFLNVDGNDELLQATQNCYVSLFTDRAIKYRLDHGFVHLQVALAVGVQRMVRADLGSAGVAFTIDPESGNEQVVYLTSAWGLGENVVQGAVIPDEFYVFKPVIGLYPRSLVHRRLGAKEHKMIYSQDRENPLVNVETTQAERNSFSLNDEDVQILGAWCLHIEKHYGMPMDIEWAKDGRTMELFIVQARPETVHARTHEIAIREYTLRTSAKPLCKGKAVGRAIVSGRACIVRSLADAGKVQLGDIIVADITNPDWNAMLRRAASIVTNKGGRTSHASIVARELGIHAVVGTGDATTKLHDGQIITVSCADGDEGKVFDGRLDWDETSVSIDLSVPTRTSAMLILANPGRAFNLARYPTQGVGLLRMEFIITNSIRIHPMALAKFAVLPDSVEKQAIEAITRQQHDKKQYFIERLSEAVALVAAAFYPREVIVRMSDFKTNEYAQLLGGKMFEPQEENPMLGFRGASRYYHPNYREGFGLECEAMRVIRDEMGLTNVKLMIPFCRTVEEGKKVLATMASFGLERGKNGLEVYVMAEIPSNVILAKQFAEIFDGFSIGSNDLTQLTLGIDRDSASISELFDESNPAVKQMLRMVIREAKAAGVKIGLCGQAPSDYPQFAQFLVEEGIDSISFNADALLKGIVNIQAAEAKLAEGIRISH
jgi:pyruvate,water dikinase